MKTKNFIKAVAFICVFAIVLSYVTKICRAKWISGTSATYVISGMYDLKENTVDVCIIGTSQQSFGLSCMRMLNKYGISAYSCATGDQPVLGSMFCMKELDKNQDIEVVLFDPGMMFQTLREHRYRTVLDYAELGKNKLEAINIMSRYRKNVDKWSYIFPVIEYHTRWEELGEKDFAYEKMNSEVFRGNMMYGVVSSKLTYDSFIIDNEEIDETVEMDPEALECLTEMVRYCKENNIELIMTKSPKPSWTRSMSYACQKFADENNITFLDFNYSDLFDAVGFDVNHDFANADHMNVRGSDKYTDYICEYLQKNCSLKYREIDDMDMMDEYLKLHDKKYFQSCVDVSQLADEYNKGNYEMLVGVSADITDKLDLDARKQLQGMGLDMDYDELKTMNYAAYIDGSRCVDYMLSDEDFEYKGMLSDGENFVVYSDISADADKCLIQVADEKINFEKKGINIVIYDKESKMVTDALTLFYDEELEK
ncbi:MAG: hypothetical protein ACI4EF_06055, partial [Coprococcus sp.]